MDTAKCAQMCTKRLMQLHSLHAHTSRMWTEHAHSHACADAHHTLTRAACVHTCVLTRTHRPEPRNSPSPAFPTVQSPGATSLQEISKDAVYTISSKEIIIIITLSDLAVKFL